MYSINMKNLKIKHLTLSFLLMVFSIGLSGQQVQFPSSILSAGGGTILSNKTHISKWRIGKVHAYNIVSEDLKNANILSFADLNKQVFSNDLEAYPNPVMDYLHLSFKMEKTSSYYINVYDMSGKKLIIHENKLIPSKQTIQIDFRGIASGMYLVNIRNTDFSINTNFKISKR